MSTFFILLDIGTSSSPTTRPTQPQGSTLVSATKRFQPSTRNYNKADDFTTTTLPEASYLSITQCHSCRSQMARSPYFWKGMNKDINGIIKTCNTCQRSKTTWHEKAKPGTYLLSLTRFKNIHLDLVGPVEQSSSDHKHLVDHNWQVPLSSSCSVDKHKCTNHLEVIQG